MPPILLFQSLLHVPLSQSVLYSAQMNMRIAWCIVVHPPQTTPLKKTDSLSSKATTSPQVGVGSTEHGLSPWLPWSCVSCVQTSTAAMNSWEAWPCRIQRTLCFQQSSLTAGFYNLTTFLSAMFSEPWVHIGVYAIQKSNLGLNIKSFFSLKENFVALKCSIDPIKRSDRMWMSVAKNQIRRLLLCLPKKWQRCILWHWGQWGNGVWEAF